MVLFAFVLSGYSPALAQQKVNVNFKDVTYERLFEEIREQTGLVVMYNSDVFDKHLRVNADFGEIELKDLLTRVLSVNGFTYRMDQSFIIVMKEAAKEEEEEKNPMVLVKGMVTDEEKVPLPGVTVRVEGTSVGTTTETNGAYSILLSRKSGGVLVFSFVGMETQKRIVGANTEADTLVMDVVLKEETQEMDEVVVTGIFTRKAESYSGSAITFKAEDLKRVGNQNVFQSLKNLDPSLLVMDNIAMGSDPNSMPSMQLRGASTFPADETAIRSRFQDDPNTPLFILDGFETTTEKIFDMDMNRIESVTILKDAAAKAIYGSKAANGVVVIETKRLSGGEARVSYIGSLDLEMPDLSSYDLCNALEKLEVERREGYYEELSTFLREEIDDWQLYTDRLKLAKEGLDTYWLSKPLHVGVGQKHTLMVELGTGALQAIGTFAYNDVKGVMKGSDRRVISGDISVSYRRGKVLFRNIMSIASMNSNDSPYGDFSTYAQLNPYVSPYDENGNLAQLLDDFDSSGRALGNPLYDATLNTKLTDSYLDFTNNFSVEVTPWEAWKFTARMSMDSKKTESEEFYPADHSKFANTGTLDDQVVRRGSYNASNGKSWTISGDFSVQFNKSFGLHDVFGTAQWSLSETEYSEVTHYTEGFPNDRMTSIIYARQYATDATPTGYSSLQRSLGYLLVGGYSYDNRYLADLTLKGTGASVFGSDKRWGTFWSVGLAWNIHNEKFLSNSGVIKQLKLRASLGTTGNENFSTNLSSAVYNYYTDRYYQNFAGAYLDNMENPNLAWEQKMDYNVGLDANIGRLLLKFDAYISDTKDMAFNRSIVASTGFTTVRDNLGQVRNKGLELSVTYSVIQRENAFLNVYFKAAANDNRIREISDALRSYNESIMEAAEEQGTTAPVSIYQDGTPVNAIWAVRSLGIDPLTGQEVFLDLDGNKTYTWSAANLVNCGSSDPKYNGNFGFNGEYKGIGLSAVFTFYAGGKMYNNTLVDRVENCYIGNNVDRRVFSDRWYEAGQEAQYVNGYDNGGTQATSRFVQDDNVLKISSLSAYYELPQRWVRPLKLQRVRLNVYMNDVATFSSIKVERGTSYPFARTLSFSLTATF